MKIKTPNRGVLEYLHNLKPVDETTFLRDVSVRYGPMKGDTPDHPVRKKVVQRVYSGTQGWKKFFVTSDAAKLDIVSANKKIHKRAPHLVSLQQKKQGVSG